MKYKLYKSSIYFYFYEEFDSLQIKIMKDEVLQILKKHTYDSVYFDFSNITYIDSTGIGFILARYRELHKEKKELILCNLKKEHKILFEMSGLFQIIRYLEGEIMDE